ncbi:MAG: class I SAM-dependent methyltransferase [Myxococcota bacterium]|nr:class I SAM-dependent methyltransferase [Myxococcota bacterium]
MSLSARLKYAPDHIVALNGDQIATRDSIRKKIAKGVYPLEEVPCFCGETDAVRIAERDRYGLPITTVLCMQCGIMRSSPRMSDQSTAKFYRNDYRALYSGARSKDELFENGMARGEMIVKQMPKLIGQVEVVYDIGCGTGGMLMPFSKAGKTVVGCDTDEAYLAYGRDKGLDLINGNAGDILKAKGKPADLVILSHTMEHFLDLRSEIGAVVDTLRPGGFLMVQVPGIRSVVSSEYKGDILLYLQNAHNYHFTAQTLTFVLQSVGLEVIAVDETINVAARRPENWSPTATKAAIPPGEALYILSFLAETERSFIAKDLPMATAAATDPWPLSTHAALRVLAWPRYDDIKSIQRVLTVAEPLFGNSDACLCLRHDNAVDIPLVQVEAQLKKACDALNRGDDLNVLIVDDPIAKADLPRLGKSLTCALQTDPDTDPVRDAFIAGLGIEIISSN